MPTRFETFLEQHKAEVVASCHNTCVVPRPGLSDAEALGVTEGVITLYYDLALGRTLMSEPDTQRRVVALRAGLLDPKDGRRRTNGMCDILHNLCSGDSTLTETERGQIQRMIEQSRIYLNTTAIPIRAPDENKK